MLTGTIDALDEGRLRGRADPHDRDAPAGGRDRQGGGTGEEGTSVDHDTRLSVRISYKNRNTLRLVPFS